MNLFINTATPDLAALFLVEATGVVLEKRIPQPRPDGQRADVLMTIEQLLLAHDLAPRDLTGVVVVTGPGHFSFLRTGVVIANTFGYTLGIPVVGVQLDDFTSDEEFIGKGLSKLAETKEFTPVMPEYGQEPNITTPKLSL